MGVKFEMEYGTYKTLQWDIFKNFVAHLGGSNLCHRTCEIQDFVMQKLLYCPHILRQGNFCAESEANEETRPVDSGRSELLMILCFNMKDND